MFAFPSLREFGGGVVVEAMACGLPPIVVNYGGPGEIASDECGIRLPMAPRKELVDRLSEAMTTLLRDPEQCRRMSAAGLERVRRHFSWPKKAAQIVTIYRDLLGRLRMTSLSLPDPPGRCHGHRQLRENRQSSCAWGIRMETPIEVSLLLLMTACPHRNGMNVCGSHGMRMTMATLFVAWIGICATVRADDSSLLWIEGENAARSSTHRNAWFDAVDPTELSGGAQIANFSEPNQPGGWAEYDVMVPSSGGYRFWLRANPCSGLLVCGQRFRVDQTRHRRDR